MRIGSLFSGIEGFGLGFEQAGCEIVWQVEKEKFCRQVLARHWPKVKRFSEVKRVGARNLQLIDCITAGVPCQDVSIAGKRQGLAGKRTGLFYHFARILQELRPAWFVFENVPGLFSSNQGRDFAEILRVLMVECGYGVSWRVLDSRYFNVAQRRERVFIVGRFGAPCPAEILFESASGGGDLAACSEARSDIAVPLTSGSGVTSNAPGRRREDDFNIIAPLADRHAVAYAAALSPGTGGGAGHQYRQKGNEDQLIVNAISPVRGGPDDNDAQGNHLVAATLTESDGDHIGSASGYESEIGKIVSSPSDSNGVRDFARLPKGMDSARYRALGNAVTVSVAHWIAKRMMAWITANAKK